MPANVAWRKEDAAGFPRRRRSGADAVLLHSIAQRIAREAEKLRGAYLVAARLRQRLFDEAALEIGPRGLIVSLAAGLLVSKGGTRGSTEKAIPSRSAS